MTTEETEQARSNGRWAESEKRWRKGVEARQFGKRVKDCRRRAGLSRIMAVQQTEGVSLSAWKAIERGDTNPLATYRKALERLQAIALAVGCTLEELTNCDFTSPRERHND